jgi:hypothetical protein
MSALKKPQKKFLQAPLAEKIICEGSPPKYFIN